MERVFKYDFEGNDDPRWIHVSDDLKGEVANRIHALAEVVIREATGTVNDPRPVCPGCFQEGLRSAEIKVARDFENQKLSMIPVRHDSFIEDMIAGIFQKRA